MMKHNIGNSVLPSSDPVILKEQIGKYGSFEVRPLHELDTHGLFYKPNVGNYQSYRLIAMHPNGYCCYYLFKRIMNAWDGCCDPNYAVEQAQYILDCGGMCSSLASIRHIAAGLA